jgi:hypothetical protein
MDSAKCLDRDSVNTDPKHCLLVYPIVKMRYDNTLIMVLMRSFRKLVEIIDDKDHFVIL